MTAVLRAVGISKRYDATQALAGVDFDVEPGTVTVLFGENGAGKSTLMKILSGVEMPTTGHLELDGAPLQLKDTVQATSVGIAIIHQELSLSPNLSISDNVFMGKELHAGGMFVDGSAQRKLARELLARLGQDLDPRTPVSSLRIGQQQLVEIARALASETRVLIMDEPTSALSATEVDVLFTVIRELRAQGVAIVYISHHLEEALEICDQAVVLRDGRVVATAAGSDIDVPWIVTSMVGRNADSLAPDLPTPTSEVVLRVADLAVADPDSASRLSVDGVSFDVHSGEIVCLFGLMGAGRTEMLEAIAGKSPILRGGVSVAGRDVTSMSISERIATGLILAPEDRQRDALVQTMTVGENASLAALLRYTRWGFVSRMLERPAVASALADVRVKTAGPRAAITSLSGGNQQKVVLAKALSTSPTVLLLDEPSRGIDVGAKSEIFTLMAREGSRGLGVLFATSEAGEALSVSHRILVMSKGRVVAELDPTTTTRDQLMIASGAESAEADRSAR